MEIVGGYQQPDTVQTAFISTILPHGKNGE
jgi:hypothetical protein